MQTLTNWDHAFALLVFIAYPLYSVFTIADILATIRRRGEPARIESYRNVILTWAGFSGALLALWWALDRPWSGLGFIADEPSRLLLLTIVAVVVTAAIVVPLARAPRNPKMLRGLADQLQGIGPFMPRSRREQRWFTSVSVNAGLSEELIFRGYLIWYLGHFLSLYWAAAAAALLFAIAHAYQGAKQLPGILMVSATAVFLFVYTGSLLVPIAFHIVLDALQGKYIAELQRAAASTP